MGTPLNDGDPYGLYDPRWRDTRLQEQVRELSEQLHTERTARATLAGKLAQAEQSRRRVMDELGATKQRVRDLEATVAAKDHRIGLLADRNIDLATRSLKYATSAVQAEVEMAEARKMKAEVEHELKLRDPEQLHERTERIVKQSQDIVTHTKEVEANLGFWQGKAAELIDQVRTLRARLLQHGVTP